MNINERNKPLSLSLFSGVFVFFVSKQQRVKRLARCEEANPDGFGLSGNDGNFETTKTLNFNRVLFFFLLFVLSFLERRTEDDIGGGNYLYRVLRGVYNNGRKVVLCVAVFTKKRQQNYLPRVYFLPPSSDGRDLFRLLQSFLLELLLPLSKDVRDILPGSFHFFLVGG